MDDVAADTDGAADVAAVRDLLRKRRRRPKAGTRLKTPLLTPAAAGRTRAASAAPRYALGGLAGGFIWMTRCLLVKQRKQTKSPDTDGTFHIAAMVRC